MRFRKASVLMLLAAFALTSSTSLAYDDRLPTRVMLHVLPGDPDEPLGVTADPNPTIHQESWGGGFEQTTRLLLQTARILVQTAIL